MLKHAPVVGRSLLVWRPMLPLDLGGTNHPARLAKSESVGAVAPLNLLNHFGEHRKITFLAAQISEFDAQLSATAIALLERGAPRCLGPTRRHVHERRIF